MTKEGLGFAIGAQRFDAPHLAPGLYIVATPIGNLADITIRALQVLAGADLVLCEDTRHSARLFEAYGIRTRRSPLHEHNERQRIDPVLDAIASGSAVALISDAGTPLLSDPGFPLVRAARERGLDVIPLPGPSALLAALAGAGLPTDAFSFVGFLPPKTGQRKNALGALVARSETLVFYESPRRLGASLADMAQVLGDRPAVVALELTKKFERFIEGQLSTLGDQFDSATRGEAVIVVSGAASTDSASAPDWRAALEEALTRAPLRSAVDEIAARFSLKRKDVYDEALARRKKS